MGKTCGSCAHSTRSTHILTIVIYLFTHSTGGGGGGGSGGSGRGAVSNVRTRTRTVYKLWRICCDFFAVCVCVCDSVSVYGLQCGGGGGR